MKLRPLLLLLGAVLLSHLPLLRAGYVQDDHVAVEAAHGSGGILASSYWEGLKGADRSLWRPVTVATYAAERAVFGTPQAPLSHAINLLLHAAVGALVFSIARALGFGETAALLGALLFAVTPSKSEAVANVVGRAEILAALFTLAAIRLALARPSRAVAWGAGLAVLLACASKETGFAALPLVAVTLVTARARGRDLAGMLLPSVLAVVIVAIARTHALEAFFPPQTIPVMDNPLVAETGVRKLATALGLVARYARIVLFPWHLSNDYSGASIATETGLLALRPLLGIALLAGGLVLALRGRTWALLVAIVLLPYLLVGNLLVPVGAIMAERFLYLPVAGLALLAASLIERWDGRAAPGVAGVLLAFLAVLMFARAIDWRNDATIFAATARNNPESPRAPYWLGSIAEENGDMDAASRELDKAIRNWPAFAPAWLDKGLVLARHGRLDEARGAFAEAVRLEPQWAQAHLDLALALHRAGDRAAALKSARKATLADPADAKAWAEAGHLFYETGDFVGATSAYRRAVGLGRSDLAARLGDAEARR